jgi:hypothetical protein
MLLSTIATVASGIWLDCIFWEEKNAKLVYEVATNVQFDHEFVNREF